MIKYYTCLICFLFFGCATKKTKEVLEHYSKDAVLDLAKQSYIRGCIEGQNLIEKKLTKGIRLSQCKELSKNHTADLIKLLK